MLLGAGCIAVDRVQDLEGLIACLTGLFSSLLRPVGMVRRGADELPQRPFHRQDQAVDLFLGLGQELAETYGQTVQAQLCDEDDAEHGEVTVLRHRLCPALRRLCAFTARAVPALRPIRGSLRGSGGVFGMVFGRAETLRIVFVRYCVQGEETRFLGAF